MTEVRVDLGYRPRAWQAECHRKRKRFTVLVVHARAGKTVWALIEMLCDALSCQRVDGQYAYVAPFLNQGVRNMWSLLKAYALRVPGVQVNEAEHWITVPNAASGRSKLYIFGADNPDALRGLYLDGVVLDEVAQMKPEVWGEVIRVRLMDRKGWCIFIGTPKGINLFSEMYQHAVRHDEGYPESDWWADLWPYQRTHALPEAEVLLAKGTMRPAQFRQEMECDFGAASDNQLIPFDLVETACHRSVREDVIGHAPRILGVDVARSETGDRSVIVKRQGLVVYQPWAQRGVDNMSLAGEVARQYDEWNADAIFIDAGRGEGVIDRLVQLGYPPVAVQFGGTDMSRYHANNRSAMWDRINEWLASGGCLTNDPQWRIDLCAPTYSRRPGTDKLALESKDELKGRGLSSPDLGDALALTFAYPVRPKVRTELERFEAEARSAKAQGEYDFFARAEGRRG